MDTAVLGGGPDEDRPGGGQRADLPLRPPVVLAREAAGLDLLSGGRFEMAIGAGGFLGRDRVGRRTRRTPRQAVQALSEAVDIFRAVWDTSERGGIRLAGEHYSVSQARPEPAHDIPIWVGALRPRMLRLIGEKADGWLPSLPYLQEGDLARGNEVIDEAAVAAGRDPRQISRLLNIHGAFTTASQGFLQGPSGQWVEDLLPLPDTGRLFGAWEGTGTVLRPRQKGCAK